MDRIVGALDRVGVDRFTVVTGHHADQVEAYLTSRWGDRVAFVRQQEQLGTAHAVLLTRDRCGEARFALAWGDIALAEKAYGTVIGSVGPADDAVIGVNWMRDPSEGAAVVFDERGVVSKIIEKPAPPAPSRWNNAGLMVLAPTIWPHVAAVEASVRGEYELTDAIAALIRSGGQVRAVRLGGPWFDIGTVEGLEAARDAFG